MFNTLFLFNLLSLCKISASHLSVMQGIVLSCRSRNLPISRIAWQLLDSLYLMPQHWAWVDFSIPSPESPRSLVAFISGAWVSAPYCICKDPGMSGESCCLSRGCACDWVHQTITEIFTIHHLGPRDVFCSLAWGCYSHCGVILQRQRLRRSVFQKW